MLCSLFAGIETLAMVAERGKKSKVKRQKAKEEDEQPYKPEKFCSRSAPALLPFAFSSRWRRAKRLRYTFGFSGGEVFAQL
jgi:hypothetical protein